MPQVIGLESKKEFMPCPGGPIILVCARGDCAVLGADETHLTHFMPSVAQTLQLRLISAES